MARSPVHAILVRAIEYLLLHLIVVTVYGGVALALTCDGLAAGVRYR
jgi:hypothetical protein